jgi:glycerol-3-phosphate acyltransferase PlsX
MRIAVDVMGGDHGCGVIIAGVKRALEENKEISAIYLVGDKAKIHDALPERGFRDHRVRIIHATEVVEMTDKPVVALRKKKDSSIARAADLVAEGKADALISLGNTGGVFAAATFKVGRIEGVDRGCIATVMPRQGIRIGYKEREWRKIRGDINTDNNG